MKIAILSDIHGNLEALTEVLRVVDTLKPDRIISLGDNVGYGPDPEAVMQIIKERQIPSVLGNHELALKRESFIKWFNPLSMQAVIHTRTHLSEESFQKCIGFPLYLALNTLRFVHGMPPASPAVYLHQVSDKKLIVKFEKLKENIAFVGHTHRLALIEYDGEKIVRKRLSENPVILDKNRKYILNAGSVGQPRDGDNRARFLLFDTEKNRLEIYFVPYNYKKTARKIIEAGLPQDFAEKLYPA